MAVKRIRDRVLELGDRWIYPAYCLRTFGESGFDIRKVLDEMVAQGELEVWEIPQYRNKVMELEAKPGTGNLFEGILDDDLDEIHPLDIRPVLAYRLPRVSKA